MGMKFDKKYNEIRKSMEQVDESMATARLSGKDRDVIKAFANGQSLASKKLSTDGKSIDSSWTGGRNIASWDENGKVNLPKKTSRKALEVQKLVKKHVEAGCLKESRGGEEFTDWLMRNGMSIENSQDAADAVKQFGFEWVSGDGDADEVDLGSVVAVIREFPDSWDEIQRETSQILVDELKPYVEGNKPLKNKYLDVGDNTTVVQPPE